MESFFSTVKSELGEHFDSHDAAQRQLFEYLEVFYNQRRRHSTLGQISPAAYERQAALIASPAPTSSRGRLAAEVPELVSAGGIGQPALDRDRGSWSLL